MANFPNEQWQRLDAVIRHCNMTVNSFAEHIGLPRSENLYQIKRGYYMITSGLADRITELHPEINREWLLTGAGMMFRDDYDAFS